MWLKAVLISRMALAGLDPPLPRQGDPMPAALLGVASKAHHPFVSTPIWVLPGLVPLQFHLGDRQSDKSKDYAKIREKVCYFLKTCGQSWQDINHPSGVVHQ